jgi:hypothetical protein
MFDIIVDADDEFVGWAGSPGDQVGDSKFEYTVYEVFDMWNDLVASGYPGDYIIYEIDI